MSASQIPMDPDAGIPDLVRRLGDDSKRLVSDEARLAKLEIKDAVVAGGHGVMWLGIAFGAGVVMLVGFTLLVATLIGRLVDGHMWLGATVASVIDMALAAICVKKGLAAYKEPSYSLEQTRESLGQGA